MACLHLRTPGLDSLGGKGLRAMGVTTGEIPTPRGSSPRARPGAIHGSPAKPHQTKPVVFNVNHGSSL